VRVQSPPLGDARRFALQPKNHQPGSAWGTKSGVIITVERTWKIASPN
jgi:hypothetical protein